MKIKELLIKKGYTEDIAKISEPILEMEVKSDTVRRTGGRKEDLYFGFELSSKKDDKMYNINLEHEENEFTPFCIFYLDGNDGYIIREEGYDVDLKMVCDFEI